MKKWQNHQSIASAKRKYPLRNAKAEKDVERAKEEADKYVASERVKSEKEAEEYLASSLEKAKARAREYCAGAEKNADKAIEIIIAGITGK